MRVKIEQRPGMPEFGFLVGMLIDEYNDMQAIVRCDGYGLMLKMLHPSKVVPVSRAEEDDCKP